CHGTATAHALRDLRLPDRAPARGWRADAQALARACAGPRDTPREGPVRLPRPAALAEALAVRPDPFTPRGNERRPNPSALYRPRAARNEQLEAGARLLGPADYDASCAAGPPRLRGGRHFHG